MPRKKKRVPKKKRRKVTGRRELYQDRWGAVIEYTRFRGAGGKYISYEYGKRFEKKRRISKEVSLYRKVDGKRGEQIFVHTPTRLLKTSAPGTVADNEGIIETALRDTNLSFDIHVAREAVYNIRGYDEDGNEVRLQGSIKLGRVHQIEQLTYAIREEMMANGYRTNYSLQILSRASDRRRASQFKPLRDVQFTVMLLA